MAELPRPRSLGFRLALANTLVFLVLLGLAFASLQLSIGAVVDARMDDDLAEDIEEFALWHAQGGDEGVRREFARETAAGEDETVFLTLFDASGAMLASSDRTHWPELALDDGLVRAIGAGSRELAFATLEVRGQETATRVVYGALSPDRVLVIGESLEERDELVELLSPVLLAVFVLVVPIAMALVWWLTRRALLGIGAVAGAARDVRAGDLARRVRARGEVEEVQELADTFDAMTARIERLIGGMRDMTDNMAHDLRSPITRIRVLAESALMSDGDVDELGRAAERIVDECDRLMHMINVSLDVAEAEAGIARTPRETVDLSARLELACELFEDIAETRRIALVRTITPACRVSGNAAGLERLFANLLDNALKFTPDGGRIELSVSRRDGKVVVAVSDTGPGVPATCRERVFERFYRADASRNANGCGLGLSYARAVARLHGGDITVGEAGCGGACFRVTLPAGGATTNETNETNVPVVPDVTGSAPRGTTRPARPRVSDVRRAMDPGADG